MAERSYTREQIKVIEHGANGNAPSAINLWHQGQIASRDGGAQGYATGTDIEVVDLDGTDLSYIDPAVDFACHEEALHIGT